MSLNNGLPQSDVILDEAFKQSVKRGLEKAGMKMNKQAQVIFDILAEEFGVAHFSNPNYSVQTSVSQKRLQRVAKEINTALAEKHDDQ